MADQWAGEVISVNAAASHRFSKPARASITLIAGIGIEGDAHAGVTVQHVSRLRRDPTSPNLRQVHLIQSELFDELAVLGHTVLPGALGENITTRGIDLLALPVGTILRLGEQAVLQVTGLRNPCVQINEFQNGLMRCLIATAEDGTVIRRGGVMSVVIESGVVTAGDALVAELPAGERRPLQPV
jgi:MOSC domain-containing protein YiiM